MAAKLRDSVRVRQPRSSWLRAVFPRPTSGYALAGIVVVAIVAWIGVRVLHPPSAEQLLAQAYSDHRTLDVRIPGAKYAPMRTTRGTGQSDFDRPHSLLKAEDLISEALTKNPNDPNWLQARARAEMLDGNYESSIKSLQRALETQPESPSLLTDVGSAYFMRAESADRPIDYGNAIEFFGKALAKSPDDPIALFNRALACNRLFLYTQEIADWEHYLTVDPSGAWADDARRRLEAARQKLRKRDKDQNEPLLTPGAFVQAVNAHDGAALSIVDGHIERYLEQALHYWIPGMFVRTASSGETRRALGLLAKVLKDDHDDTWLSDFLNSPESKTEEQALSELLASERALDDGSYGQSMDFAKRSIGDFRSANNQAGELRAGFSLMLAQAFALRSTECLRTAKLVLPAIERSTYRWLDAQTLIEQGQCLEAASQLQAALRITRDGSHKAKQFRYPGLQLRAAAFAADYQSYAGGAEQPFHIINNALLTFWQSDAPNVRGQNLYAVLADIADQSNWPYLDSLALSEIATSFPTKDPTDRALRRVTIAEAQQRAGNYETAQRSLQAAVSEIAGIPKDEAVMLVRAEITLDEASIRLHSGHPQDAITALDEVRGQFEHSSAGLLKAEYFGRYAEALLALGQESAAEPLLDSAVAEVESGLTHLSRESDKLSWSRMEEQIYRDMLQVRLKLYSPNNAFSWWEWYRGASLRAPNGLAANPSDAGRALDPGSIAARSSHDVALVSYALLNDSIVAFVLRDGIVNVSSTARPVDLEKLTARFLDNCADPSSDLDLLSAESKRLYRIVFGPLETELQGVTRLQIETDGILDQIPFHLLQDGKGTYLGDTTNLSFSEGTAYELLAKAQATDEPITPGSAALIVAVSGAPDSLPVLPDANNEGQDVASYFKRPIVISGTQVDRKEVLAYLRETQVFHFAGHAVATAGRVGLLLGPDSSLDASSLHAWRPRNLRLAVLSACDTAIGEGGRFTDVNSLARTLVAAGVAQVVASRWRVDSIATQHLMGLFYSHLMSGQSATESLRRASLETRKLPAYRHPCYWASFAVFGNI